MPYDGDHFNQNRQTVSTPALAIAVAAVISVITSTAITIALGMSGLIPDIGIDGQRNQTSSFHEESDSSDPVQTSELPGLGQSLSPEVRTPVQFTTPPTNRIRIDDCNGSRYDGANFRAYPSFRDSAIQGVVLTGDWVILTDEFRRSEDDNLWRKVINESRLSPSTVRDAQNRLDAYQIGWIDTCFIE